MHPGNPPADRNRRGGEKREMLGKKYTAEFKIRIVKEFLDRKEKESRLSKSDFAFENKISDSTFVPHLFSMCPWQRVHINHVQTSIYCDRILKIYLCI